MLNRIHSIHIQSKSHFFLKKKQEYLVIIHIYIHVYSKKANTIWQYLYLGIPATLYYTTNLCIVIIYKTSGSKNAQMASV